MVRYAYLHRGRDFQRLVNAAEIIPSRIEGECRDMVFEFFAESVRKPREPALLQASLTMKLKRGAFDASFLLAALAALEMEGIKLADI